MWQDEATAQALLNSGASVELVSSEVLLSRALVVPNGTRCLLFSSGQTRLLAAANARVLRVEAGAELELANLTLSNGTNRFFTARVY